MTLQFTNKDIEAAESTQTSECLARIRLHYGEFFEAEKRLADYFLSADPEEAQKDSVKQLAEKTGVSVASVVRFCQKLGYSGYAEFKLMLKNVGFIPAVGNITLDERMSAGELKKNITDFASLTIQKCVNTIDDAELQSSIELIRNARHLMICGIGASSGIAVSAANTFMNLNKQSFPLTDALLMLRMVSCAQENDVVLAITNCGYVKPIVDAMKVAKDAGAKTVLITGEKKSLARKYADHVLLSNYDGAPGVLEMLTITMSQVLTIQILQAGCILKNDPETMNKITSNAALAEMTRYSAKVDAVKKKRVGY